MKRTAITCVTCLWLACAPTPAPAQDANAPRPRDPIAEHVLPPELILQHQRSIGLSEPQKNAVIADVKRTQGQLLDAQWDLQREVERLEDLLGRDKVDEQQVLAQLDKVLAVERGIKRAHLALAVRLKSILTLEQQSALRGLRSSQPRPGDPVSRR